MKIVIEGAGEVGSHLAKMLRDEANDVTVIDNDPKRLAALASYADVETVAGNPSSISVLRQAGVEKADLYIAVYPFVPQEVNIVGALLAKKLGAAKVVVRVNDEDALSAENSVLYKDLGIELMFYPEKSAASEIAEYLKHSSAAETMDFAKGKLQVAVFRINEESPVIDMTMGEFIKMLTPEQLLQFRVIAVSRDEQSIIPNLSTKFHYGDLVYTISKREGVDALYGYFGMTKMQVRRVMIFGGEPIGAMLARMLAKQGVAVKIIESDHKRCMELSEALPDSVLIVNGDGRNSDFLFEEGIRDYDAFVAVTGNGETNVLTCVVAKKLGVPRTVAEVENIEYVHLAEEMGVDNVINKKLITASRIFKFTLSGKARFVRYMKGTNAEVIEYKAAPGSVVTKAPIKDLDFPRNAIIGGIIRGNEASIAVGNTQIEAYDRVAIFALPESIREIDRFFR